MTNMFAVSAFWLEKLMISSWFSSERFSFCCFPYPTFHNYDYSPLVKFMDYLPFTLSVMGFLNVIFSWGGLKDPQPKTGLSFVRSSWQSYHVTRSLTWPITQKMRSLALKMKKIMSISFFEEILEFTRIRQVYKGKVGRGNF